MQDIFFYKSFGKVRKLLKGKNLIKENTLPNVFFLVTEGIFRKAKDHQFEGDLTREIYVPGDIIFPAEALTEKKRTDYYIESLANAEVITFSVDIWGKLDCQFTQQLFKIKLLKKEKLSSLFYLDVESRYQLFLEYYGPFANYIPLNIVASYLNMNVSTLSRVRKKLAEKAIG